MTTLYNEAWLLPFVPEYGEIAIDVGANRGMWTRWLAERYMHVYAIEPNKVVLPVLKQDLPLNVTVYEIAVSSEAGMFPFNVYECPDHLSSYFKEEGIATGPVIDRIELAAVPLDDLSFSGKIDFIKIDTEGAEVHCVLGAEKLILANEPELMIEIHSADNYKQLNEILCEWDYSCHKIDHPLLAPDSPLLAEHFWLACHKA
jgi:FkbM family methyltransferase